MAFTRPSLVQLIDRVKKDLDDKLNNGSPSLRRSVLSVFSRVIGAASHILHGHLDWISRQVLPDTSDEDFLLRQGSIFNVTRKPATFAHREILVTGLNGSIVPTNQEWQRSDGVLYKFTGSPLTISAGTALVPIDCETAGSDGNVDTGVFLQLITPLSGIDNQAAVQSTNQINGEAQEDIEAFRARLLFRMANTPQGGTVADYKRWALEVPQVTRAFVYPKNTGPGTVGLSFVLDNEISIIPGSPKVAEMQSYIDARRPVTVDFTAFAPVSSALNFTIQLLPDTADIRAAVEAQLRDLLLRDAEPGVGILLSHINEAISIAVGENDHILSSPSANVPAVTNTIYIFGAITWV